MLASSLMKAKFKSRSRSEKTQRNNPLKRNREGSSPVPGVVKRHPDGFGFFIPDNPEMADVYIPKHSMKGVMTNDRVSVSVYPEPGGKRFRGEISEILKRNLAKVTGQYHEMSPGKGILRDTSGAWGDDLKVIPHAVHRPNNGDWVSVEIVSFPGSDEGFRGKLVAVIGDALDPMNDALRVLHSHNIPHRFSTQVMYDVERLPNEVTEPEVQGRRDLRAIPLITIDGRTAKDFDDAIYVEKHNRGFRLIVAIADVSHYVKPGTALDEEAYLRGTSTYFPNFVSPMLPEKLSNHLCSLNPHVNRLALACQMEFDFQGVMEKSEVFEAVIKSHARVIYGEAQEVIDGETPEHLRSVEPVILRAADLAKILMAKRFREGSIDLEIPETEVELDDTGHAVDIIRSERLFSHRMIEEMMLMANVAVALEFTRREAPGLYRIHEPPDRDSIELLKGFLDAFGSKVRVGGQGLLQTQLTKALQAFDGQPQQHVLHILTLRSMSQAKYSPHNVGHFGLGFSDYAHFTSPIRRYPDLIVHRLLKAIVLEKRGYEAIGLEELEGAGSHLSACEQRSVKAERQIQAIKKARFMSQFLGQEFEGMVTSVTKFGLFVLLRQFEVDGLVRLEDLGGERFEFDEENLRLVAKKSGMSYSIGDLLKVQVAATDSDQGRVDFVLAGGGELVQRNQSAHKSKKSGFKASGGKKISGKKKSSSRSSSKKSEQDRSSTKRSARTKHSSSSRPSGSGKSGRKGSTRKSH